VAVVPGIHVLRDPTRGGLAAVLNEIALQSGVGIKVREADIPVRTCSSTPVQVLLKMFGDIQFSAFWLWCR